MSPYTIFGLVLAAYAFGAYCQDRDPEATRPAATFFGFAAFVIFIVRITLFFA